MKQAHRDPRTALEIRRLAYRATRNASARYVLHDALLETLPVYEDVVASAEYVARSFERSDKHGQDQGKRLVVFNRKKFAEHWRKPWKSLREEEHYLGLVGPLNVHWKRMPPRGTPQDYILDRINQFFTVKLPQCGVPLSDRWNSRDAVITYVSRHGRWKELEEPTTP